MSFLKSLALAIIASSILLKIVVLEINPLAVVAQQIQSTSLNLSQEDLQQPHWLTIEASSIIRLQGQIRLNGRVIQTLNGNRMRLNLSPYLKPGRQEVVITGNYAPSEATIFVELNSKETQVRQQTSGNGSLNQILIINVQ